MVLLALLWALSSAAEGVLYTNVVPFGYKLRLELLRLILLFTLACALLLVIYNWKLWLLASVLGAYRLVNGLRYLRQRLPARQLQTVSLRAYGWLIVVQLFCLMVSWLWIQLHVRVEILSLLASIQFGSALLLLRASLHTWSHTQFAFPDESLTSQSLPSLSVLIPARNETDDLKRCLTQLVASDYPKLEIIVFDDNSANRRTPEIIRSFAHAGVRFVQGKEPDVSRWLPKNHAYANLRSEASGELLLFCGVDALFKPSSIRRLVEVLLIKHKDMLSVLPLKDAKERPKVSLLQPMRYYWELCLPRRFFKRPPVLSTSWLIRAEALDRAGGFQAVARSITPEAYFARQAVVTDAYSFIRSNESLGISSAKSNDQQYATSIRMRYPQLHRRLELVAITALLELVLMLGPIIGLIFVKFTTHHTAYAAVWIVSLACLVVTYYLAAVTTKLNSAWTAWLFMPLAFMYDIAIQHISFYKYEFSRVEWKGRDVSIPVMQVVARLPEES